MANNRPSGLLVDPRSSDLSVKSHVRADSVLLIDFQARGLNRWTCLIKACETWTLYFTAVCVYTTLIATLPLQAHVPEGETSCVLEPLSQKRSRGKKWDNVCNVSQRMCEWSVSQRQTHEVRVQKISNATAFSFPLLILKPRVLSVKMLYLLKHSSSK